MIPQVHGKTILIGLQEISSLSYNEWEKLKTATMREQPAIYNTIALTAKNQSESDFAMNMLTLFLLGLNVESKMNNRSPMFHLQPCAN